MEENNKNIENSNSDNNIKINKMQDDNSTEFSSEKNNNICKNSRLSVLALVLMVGGIINRIAIIISMTNRNASFMGSPFNRIPWFVTSLILAIISRSKCKDKLSKIIIIMDVIIFVLEFVYLIISIYYIAYGFGALFNHGLKNLQKMYSY